MLFVFFPFRYILAISADKHKPQKGYFNISKSLSREKKKGWVYYTIYFPCGQ